MMENCYDKSISVIVLSYNSALEDIYCTLESIIRQKDVSYEIVMADDGSDTQFFAEIEEYFNRKNFSDYVIVKANKNVGTVKNLVRALEYVHGKYVKGIGVGDCLYNEYVLREIVRFAERENVKIGFGRLQGFRKITGTIVETVVWSAPKDILPYIKNKQKIIVKNMIVYEDYISGASMFFDKKYFSEKLQQIEKVVIYCEDLLQVLSVLEGERIAFLDIIVVYYEIGSGISTNKVNGKINPRMVKDHQQFNEYLLERYNYSIISERIRRKSVIINKKMKICYGLKNVLFYIRKTKNLLILKNKKTDLEFLGLVIGDSVKEKEKIMSLKRNREGEVLCR